MTVLHVTRSFLYPLPATRYPLHTICLLLIPVLLAACAPQKAYIDRTAEAQIIWPGPPERPRIKYLWSVSMLSSSGEGRRTLSDFILGDFTDEVTDPRTSNTLMRPYALFMDGRERLLVADPGASRVTVIDMKTSEVLNVTGAGSEEFLSPVGVAADSAGRIYVSDSLLAKVYMLDERGRLLSALEGEFKRPTCLAIDRGDSTLYVADTLDHRVFRYSPDGRREGSVGGPGSEPGQFNFPTHLFVDGAGFLYVTDSMNFRIQIFDRQGSFVSTLGRPGNTHSTLDKPKGVAVDSDGNVYVVDSLRDTVKIFDREDRLLLFFGERGHGLGQFWLPSGIFIDSLNRIYVADSYNMRVQAFQYLGDGKETTKK